MNLRVLIGYAWPYRASLAICSVLMLVETGAALAVPWFGGRFAGAVFSGHGVDVTPIMLALLCLFALQGGGRFANGYFLSRTSAQMLADLRIRIYDHLQALPLSFYHERRQGDILALLTYEVAQLSGFVTGTLLSIIPLLVTAMGAVMMMLWIDIQLAVLVAALIPLFYGLLRAMGRRLRPLAVQIQKAQADAVATESESLEMLPVIKTFTREADMSARHKAQVQHVSRLSITQQRIYAALQPVMQFIASAAVLLLLWWGGARISNNNMTPAELVSFLLFAALLTRPISALAGVYGNTQLARGTLERMERVLAERSEPIFRGGRTLKLVRGEIEFRDVSFAYPGRPATLRDTSFHIPAGETLAFTGENGTGKSTIAHLLMRLHEPCAGQIFIDGTDIAGVNLHSLRRHIGFVPQHVLLFNGSVRDNIGYGRTDATSAHIEHAARAAQAHTFIEGLPQGYETLIGDNGVKLSGGQRQRIALARALIKDPPILILDEATAMFDNESELSFLKDCRASFTDRTVIFITHRPASLELADRVVLVSLEGMICESEVRSCTVERSHSEGRRRADNPNSVRSSGTK